MLFSSLGHHTYTMIKRYLSDDNLLDVFQKYADNTGRVRIYPIDQTTNSFKIDYVEKNKGLRWQITSKDDDNLSFGASYILAATINPKLLAGNKDYSTVANQEYTKIVEERFSKEANEISKNIGEFSNFEPSRIIYCVNLDLNELGVNCTAEQILELFKYGYFPASFRERQANDNASFRMRNDGSSIYLVAQNVAINCYQENIQLPNPLPDDPYHNDTHNIIRFEVQFMYKKIAQILRALGKNNTIPNYKIMYELLSDEIAKKVITHYYYLIFWKGNYYSLDYIINEIKSHGYTSDTASEMINALLFVNKSGGISQVFNDINTNNWNSNPFDSGIIRLSNAGINPVTIPKEWGIKNILNPLSEFLKLEDESRNGMNVQEKYTNFYITHETVPIDKSKYTYRNTPNFHNRRYY